MPNCIRRGCGKTLRIDNTTGKCSSNCLSADAPASQRAKDVQSPRRDDVEVKSKKSDPALREKFETVATALGFDPDTLLDEARQGWLDAAGERLREANEEE